LRWDKPLNSARVENLNRYWIFGHLLSSALVIVMLTVVVSLLRSRRPPGSTLAWIFAVILIPYVGIPLYFLFGVRKIRRLSTGDRVNEPVEIWPNTEVEIVTGGVQAYNLFQQQLQSAQRSIDLATFIFARDEVGQALLNQLIEKAKSGVRVRLLVDALGSSLMVRPSFSALREAGAEVAFFKPLLRLRALGQVNLRNHRKLLVIDDESAIFGGMNLAHEYLGPIEDEKRWADLAIHLRGSSVQRLRALFAHDWQMAHSQRGKPPPHPAGAALAVAETHLAQIVASGPDHANDPLYDQLLSACFEARQRIWIATPYFVPDETLTKALSLASLRGVDVRLLVPKKSNHLFADLCRGSYVRQLRDMGVKIYLYPKMSHAKLVLIDEQRALVGSANFDLRSLLYNYELGVFLYSPSEIQVLDQWLSKGFAQAELLHSSHPGIVRETIEGMVRVFGPLF
jgi:cardiolipin synthase